MKKICKTIINFIFDIINFILFFILRIKDGSHKSCLRYKKNEKNITLLANGPSLKNHLSNILSKEDDNTDYIVLNFFAYEPLFKMLKPSHYCLVDPMFFRENHKFKEVNKLFSILQDEVDWKLTIYIPGHKVKEFLLFSKINNPNILIRGVNVINYRGFESLRYYYYRKGWAMPIPYTVANFAIYISLNLGYKNIYLYGVDHTFFDSLCVNINNELCRIDEHFYESECVLKPIRRNDNNEIWKMSDYTFSTSMMFHSHDLLAKYSEYLKSNVINCTECSLIDSYKRKK